MVISAVSNVSSNSSEVESSNKLEVKSKIPDISVEWLLYGTGEMYVSHPAASSEDQLVNSGDDQELMLNFDNPVPVSSNGNSTRPA